MVSKASEDLPEPDTPVITTSRSRGISRSIDCRLCSRAPRMRIVSVDTLALLLGKGVAEGPIIILQVAAGTIGGTREAGKGVAARRQGPSGCHKTHEKNNTRRTRGSGCA